MADASKKIEEEALKLPADERAKLARRLLSSLETEIDENVEESWLMESEQRIVDLEAGRVETLPAESVIADVRSKLR